MPNKDGFRRETESKDKKKKVVSLITGKIKVRSWLKAFKSRILIVKYLDDVGQAGVF